MKFTNKYQPQSINECILPNRIKDRLNKLIQRKDLGHCYFFGNSGIGKTSTAQILINQLAPENHIKLNATQDQDVHFIEDNVIKAIASVPVQGIQKQIILIDECDGLSDDAQKLLRIAMEQMDKHTSMILIGSQRQSIQEQIFSRCYTFDFNVRETEEADLKLQIQSTTKKMCEIEEIDLTDELYNQIITENFPDIRKIYNEIELEFLPTMN